MRSSHRRPPPLRPSFGGEAIAGGYGRCLCVRGWRIRICGRLRWTLRSLLQSDQLVLHGTHLLSLQSKEQPIIPKRMSKAATTAGSLLLEATGRKRSAHDFSTPSLFCRHNSRFDVKSQYLCHALRAETEIGAWILRTESCITVPGTELKNSAIILALPA